MATGEMVMEADVGTFDGKAVIVTGGAQGIGAGTAVEFARAGASVAIADVNMPAGREVLRQIQEDGGRSILIEADVSQAIDCERVVDETASAFGGVDVLFNNVGIQPPESYTRVEDTSEEMWDRVLGVNLKSRFLMAKYTIPEMRKRGGGVIISSASVQGLQSMNEVPAYAASKGGDISLTRQMALDYAHENIRVLTVCPGGVDTPLWRGSMAGDEVAIQAALKRSGLTHPVGRVGQPGDIASVVLFLASDGASFMTGEYICVDGGLMAKGAWATSGGAGHQ
jgi:3-oxoacyl-[acyl-carrier protein] reductase